MKRFWAMLLAGAMLFSVPVPVSAEETSGVCGAHISWEYADGTLTLSGWGDMDNYSIYDNTKPDVPANSPPWLNLSIEAVEIADGITSVGDYAFMNKNQLTEIHLPDSVQRIGKYAFTLTGLTAITLSAPVIDDYAFYLCNALSTVEMLSGVTAVGVGCFAMDTNLETVTVPETVTNISATAFKSCSKWYQSLLSEQVDFLILGDGILYKYFGSETEVTVPDSVKQIGEEMFVRPVFVEVGDSVWTVEEINTAVTSVTLPDSVTTIADRAFQGMTGLTGVNLPETVTAIGADAFSGCTALTALNIPAGVTDIGGNAFYETPWLKSAGDLVILGDGVLYCHQGRQKAVTVPDSVRTICANAFRNDKIVELRIPETVTAIEPDAIVCKNAVIMGKTGSAAEAYAAAHGIPFVEMGTETQDAGFAFDYTADGWSFGNSSSAFGGDYFLTDVDRTRLTALGYSTDGVDKAWEGSCVGLSVTVILAKYGVFTPAMLDPAAKTLAEVQPTAAVQSFINYYQCIQGRDRTVSAYESMYLRFYRMIAAARTGTPFLLTFALQSGSHGVVGYGCESGAWELGGKVYDSRILVWDPNFPAALHEDSCLYFDSETFDYCIPYYGVHVSDADSENVGGIIQIVLDAAQLNVYPYPFDFAAGDVNCDGRITVSDAILIARITAEDSSVNLTEAGFANADYDADGVITALDVTALLRHIASLEETI